MIRVIHDHDKSQWAAYCEACHWHTRPDERREYHVTAAYDHMKECSSRPSVVVDGGDTRWTAAR